MPLWLFCTFFYCIFSFFPEETFWGSINPWVVGKNPDMSDVQEADAHDHVQILQVCFVEQLLDLVSRTKISAQQLLVAE